MTKLEQLLEQLCPNGVEYKEFGEIATISRGASPRPIKSFLTDRENGVHWIKIGDVKTGAKYIESTDEYITLEGAKKSRAVKKGDFILSNSMSFGRPYILKIDGYIHDGWLSISGFEQNLLSDFLYYVLNSSFVQAEMRKRASFGGAVQNLNADIVRGLTLPVPPLEVQAEIVRILDTFTEHTTELTTELANRKKQYEYYRDALFCCANYEKKVVTEIADTYIGLVTTMTKHYVPNGVKLIHNSDVKENRFEFSKDTFLDEEFAEKNKTRKHKIDDIITVHTGDVGTSAVIDKDLDGSLGFATIVSRIKDKKVVLPKYLCYYLNSHQNKYNIVSMIKGDRNNLNLKDFNRLTIPVPPIEEQQRIVDILDRFDKLCNDISEGLPAEIEARQKQYEYYRDKLLTFTMKE